MYCIFKVLSSYNTSGVYTKITPKIWLDHKFFSDILYFISICYFWLQTTLDTLWDCESVRAISDICLLKR